MKECLRLNEGQKEYNKDDTKQKEKRQMCLLFPIYVRIHDLINSSICFMF